MPLPDSYIASLDVGTSSLRCIILNSQIKIVGSAKTTVKLLYPKPGFVEIDPNQLWEQVVDVIKKAISDADLKADDIKCLGISTQRATFVTWHRTSGKPIHNFITWKDIRAKQLCKELNSSLFMGATRLGSFFLYLFSWSNRFLTGSKLKIYSNHVTGRLLWAMKFIPELKSALSDNDVMFGTVDTWLIYKFSKGNLHVTDISNASATGFFDPFVLDWGSWAKIILGIPGQILPKVVDNDFDFGTTAEEIFGFQIPIKCVMADQSSSLFGSSCFENNDVKITLGTGAFLDVNTDAQIHTSVTGIYPLVGWKINKKMVYIGEVPCNDCGSLIEWLLNLGLFEHPSDIEEIIATTSDSDGVYFIPAFSGLGPPINDERASSGFLGIKPTTTKNHLVRSVLEGIAYRLVLAFQTLKKERDRNYSKFKIDGGVSQSDFMCHILADLTGLVVERLNSPEMSGIGVGFAAGLSAGIWKNTDELNNFITVEKLFKPRGDTEYRNKCLLEFNNWLKAVERFKLWYKD